MSWFARMLLGRMGGAVMCFRGGRLLSLDLLGFVGSCLLHFFLVCNSKVNSGGCALSSGDNETDYLL